MQRTVLNATLQQTNVTQEILIASYVCKLMLTVNLLNQKLIVKSLKSIIFASLLDWMQTQCQQINNYKLQIFEFYLYMCMCVFVLVHIYSNICTF